MLHIHQGGTLQTYCGRPLTPSTVAISWEEAARTTCATCARHF